MRATVLTADSGQTENGTGKLHALGIGWTSLTVPTMTPIAVVVIVSFDSASEAAGSHEIAVSLLDEHRRPVLGPDDTNPLMIKATVDVTPQPEVPATTPAVAPLVLNIGPGFVLEPDRRYVWQATIDGETEESWSALFVTRRGPDA
jgi:hypothetical protein